MATQEEPTSWADEVEEESLRGLTHGSLSWISWAFISFLVVLALFIVVMNVEDAALLPGFVIGPFVVLYFGYWRHLRQEIPVDLVVKNFAFGFLPGSILVMVVESILTGLFFILCFSDQAPGWLSQLQKHAGQGQGGLMVGSSPGSVNATSGDPDDPLQALENSLGIKITRTPGFYIFIFLLAYGVAAWTEETMKYCTPLRFRGCRNSPSPYLYLVCTVASALGFSSVENVGYTFSGGGLVGFQERMITAYSRAVVAVMAHSVCGGIVGMGLTRRYVLGHDLSYFGILAPAVLTHGTFDFLQLILATMVMDETTRNVGVVIACASVLLSASIYLFRGIRRLQLHRLRHPDSVPGMMHERAASETDDEEKLLR